MEEDSFERSRSLLGEDSFERIRKVRVAVFGVGGVGGWCAEALLRTGVRRLVLIDDDSVAASNINRQRQAQPSTIGRLKVEALREMLLDIAPDANILAVSERYTPESANRFERVLADADFVIDAIDSVDCKAHLIRQCTSRSAPDSRKPEIFSSMGAALRLDPTKVRISPFNRIAGDGLARALRNRFRKSAWTIPRHLCVHSEELPHEAAAGIKGSVMPVTCTFGMALAHLVANHAGSAVMA